MSQVITQKINSRDAILNAAEALFASYGYYAVSVRDITGLAKTRVAAINDFFGGKEKLFYEVIKRRAVVINAERDKRLEALDTNLPPEEQLKYLISAFFSPLLEQSAESEGWRHYLRLVAQMAGLRSPILLTVIEFYNPISQRYLQIIHTLYPGVEFSRLLRYWQLILASYMSVFADNFRVNSLSAGKVQSSDFSLAYSEATEFIYSGLRSLM